MLTKSFELPLLFKIITNGSDDGKVHGCSSHALLRKPAFYAVTGLMVGVPPTRITFSSVFIVPITSTS
jgi:hypothetical protein